MERGYPGSTRYDECDSGSEIKKIKGLALQKCKSRPFVQYEKYIKIHQMNLSLTVHMLFEKYSKSGFSIESGIKVLTESRKRDIVNETKKVVD